MSRIRSTIASLFPVRSDEIQPLGFLLLLSFFRGLAAVFFDAPANTLFISRFGSGPLPYVYLGAAGSSLLLGFAYSRIGATLPPARALRITLTILVASILGFFTVLQLTPSRWVAMGLMIWKESLFMLGNIVIWAAAGYLFNVRQGKRLFGLVASGGILASIIGGALVPWLVKAFGISSLFLLSAIAMGMMLWVLTQISHRYRPQFLNSSEAPDTVRTPHSITDLFHNRYLGLFFSLSVLSNFGFFFVDYVYFNRVETAFPDEKTLAGFFGLFTSIVGFTQLITSAFLSGPLITRFGLGFGLMALPALNVVGMGAAAGISLTWGAGTPFFWLILLTKLCDEALRSSLLGPSFRILYQPLPAHERLRFQAVTESIIEPIGVGLAGGVLLLFTHAYPLSLHALCFLLVIILITWLAVGERLRREYTRLLTQALTKRRLGEGSITMEDGSTIQLFEEGLKSANPGEVIYCLNMLEEVKHPHLPQFLRTLLDHAEESVRRSVLEKIEKNGTPHEIPLLKDRLPLESSPKIRGAILQTLCALAEAEAVETVSPFLDHSSPEVRSGAMVGLMRHGGIDGVLTAGGRLQSMVASPHAHERLFAAQTLGEIGIRSFYRPLLRLIEDSEIAVRQMAVRAAGRLQNPKLLPPLMRCLEEPALRAITIGALVQTGEAALPSLEERLQAPHQSLATRLRILKIVGRMGGPAAVAQLRQALEIPDKAIRLQALQSLSLCHYRATEKEASPLQERVIREAEEATHMLRAWVDLGDHPTLSPLRQALLNETKSHQNQILLLLSFVYDARPLLFARKELESHSSAQRAHALELIDNVISKEIKSRIFPLLDELSPQERLHAMERHFPTDSLSSEARLRQLIQTSGNSLWTRACALYASKKIQLQDRVSLAQPLQHHPERLIQETARWVCQP